MTTTQINPIAALLTEKPVLLADGATGTNLFQMGLMSGDPPELWNLDEPDKIRALHQGFVDAGSDIILTNSFGGTRHRLKLHNAQGKVFEINKAAAELAREVADGAGRKVIVGGSVGPTGELFEPLGALTHADAVEAFAEQIRGLKAGGAELAWIETMSADDEIIVAATAAIEVGLPYAFTGSFDTAGKTMMGVEPAHMHHVCDGLECGPVALGANCGVGAPDILAAILAMAKANPQVPLIVKGNCGIPQFEGTEIVYSGTPRLMADYARLAIDAGASIVGGCCGTTFEHVAAMREAIDTHNKCERPTFKDITRIVGPFVNTTALSTKKVKPSRGRRRRKDN